MFKSLFRICGIPNMTISVYLFPPQLARSLRLISLKGYGVRSTIFYLVLKWDWFIVFTFVLAILDLHITLAFALQKDLAVFLYFLASGTIYVLLGLSGI